MLDLANLTHSSAKILRNLAKQVPECAEYLGEILSHQDKQCVEVSRVNKMQGGCLYK